jgi:hypothetical protein
MVTIGDAGVSAAFESAPTVRAVGWRLDALEDPGRFPDRRAAAPRALLPRRAFKMSRQAAVDDVPSLLPGTKNSITTLFVATASSPRRKSALARLEAGGTTGWA